MKMKRITFGELLRAMRSYVEEAGQYTLGAFLEEGGVILPFRNTNSGEVQIIIEYGE